MAATINNGMCRCCAAEGSYKDFRSVYHWMGEQEVYADMLQECLDITLTSSENINNGGICELCITQLRNASNFKKQVLQTEQRFNKMVNDLKYDVKLEIEPKDTFDSQDSDHDIAEDFSAVEFEMPIKEEESEPEPEPEPEIEESDGPKTRKRPAKASTSKAKKTKKDVAETSTKRTVGDTTLVKQKKKHHSATPERHLHRVNLSAILKYSNAAPFRDKTIRGFSCLYCGKYFLTLDLLREHTSKQSEKQKINKMVDYKLSYNPIKLDITNLKCNICNSDMKNLNIFKDHLISEHNHIIHKTIKDIILPFRLEDGTNYKCVICSDVHISFKNLYHHMSTHYSNYCCQKCGVGYITISALRKHDKTHYQGSFKCDYCDKTYTSLTKKKNHEKGVHTGGWLRNKCPHCPLIFTSYYDRSEHLVKVHNEAPVVYPCNACSKTYKKKFELNRHIKHHHLQQKRYVCDLCTAKFFSKRGLEDHLSKHMGGEEFSCHVCGKNFSRLRSLKLHLKTHDCGNQFQCDICKKSFTHKSSLKFHARVHQDDMDIFKEFDDVKHLIDPREMTLKEIAEENKMKENEKRAKLEKLIEPLL